MQCKMGAETEANFQKMPDSGKQGCGKQDCRRAAAGALDWRLPGGIHEEVCNESQRDSFSQA
jgi:hypothetical protein